MIENIFDQMHNKRDDVKSIHNIYDKEGVMARFLNLQSSNEKKEIYKKYKEMLIEDGIYMKLFRLANGSYKIETKPSSFYLEYLDEDSSKSIFILLVELFHLYNKEGKEKMIYDFSILIKELGIKVEISEEKKWAKKR